MKLDVSLIAGLESLHVYACTITEKELKVFTTILMWFEVFEIAETRCLSLAVYLLSKTRKQLIF